MHVTSPFTDVTTFSTRPVDLNLSDKDVVEVRSSQGGVMYAEVTVKWAVVPSKAVELVQARGQRGRHPAAAGLPGQPGDRPQRLRPPHQRGGLRLRPREDQQRDRRSDQGAPRPARHRRHHRQPAQREALGLAPGPDRPQDPAAAGDRAGDRGGPYREGGGRAAPDRGGGHRHTANKILNDSLTDKVLDEPVHRRVQGGGREEPGVRRALRGGGSANPLIVDGTKN